MYNLQNVGKINSYYNKKNRLTMPPHHYTPLPHYDFCRIYTKYVTPPRLKLYFLGENSTITLALQVIIMQIK